MVEGSQNQIRLLLLGSPGIEKPFCLLYFLARLSSKKNAIALLNDPEGCKALLCSELDAALQIQEPRMHRKALREFSKRGKMRVTFLTQEAKGSKAEPIARQAKAKLIAAASPDLSNYNQRLKGGPRKAFMEPWHFEELGPLNWLLDPPLLDEGLKRDSL